MAPNPALPSCAACPQHWALSLLPFDDGISTGVSSKSCQVAEKKRLEAFRGCRARGAVESSCVGNTMFAHFQGDAGFWVILERVEVVPRREIFKSLLTTTSALCFILQNLVCCKFFIPQKESVLEITGSIGTSRMRFQESTFSSALPNKTWIH